MRYTKTYLPEDSLYPYKGLNTLDPSTLTDPHFSSNCVNMFSDKGVVTKRRGYNFLGTDLVDPILALPTYESESSGLLTCFAITSHHQYRYDTESEKWLDCFNVVLDNFTTITAWAAEANVGLTVETGKMKVTVAEAFTTGLLCHRHYDPVVDLTGANCLVLRVTPSISLSEGDLSVKLLEGVTTVEKNLPEMTAGVESLIYINTDLSAMEVVEQLQFRLNVNKAAFNFYVDYIGTVIYWTGEEDSWVDCIEGLDENGHYLFITNNYDKMVYWDGSVMQYYVPTAGLDNFITCRTVATYLGSLVLGNIVINDLDERHPNTVAYSTPGDFFDFGGTTADIVLLDTTRGGIERIMLLGEALAIYAVNSIGVARFVEGAARYVFDQIIYGETRLLSGRGVINLGAFHALVMQDNIYLFNGTKALVPIAMNIQRTYEESIEIEQLNSAFAFNDTFGKRAYFVLPVKAVVEGEKKVIIFVAEYGDFTLRTMEWSIQDFTNVPRCFGFFSEDKTILWDSVFGNAHCWADPSINLMTWRDCSVSPGFPFVVFGDKSKVYILDKRSYLDNEEESLGEWESIDFVVPQAYQSVKGRWTEIELELSGFDVSISYSVDKGLSFIAVEEDILLTTDRTTYKLFIDVVSPHLRIKLSSLSYFKLYWLRLWLTAGGL